jgi:trans-2,3-dihydro-3-hydroxyanthranilate isomerase
MTVLRYAIVDVFTDVPLEGNAVAVFIGGSRLDSEAMQRAARELNLSETVFVLPPEDQEGGSGGDARIRIFTPSTELPFAGHPVLGTAFVVGERLAADIVRLQTDAGLFRITLQRERGLVVFGEMEQQVPVPEPFERERELLDALDLERSELPVEAYRNGPRHVYVALESEEQVAALHPDMRALSALDGGIGVNCFAGAEDRYKTRMFAPSLGVAEDPATGSAAGPLAVHLARHGRIAFGQEIAIRQGAEIGRPSELRARVEGSRERVDRVFVGGSALIVARGEYRLA